MRKLTLGSVLCVALLVTGAHGEEMSIDQAVNGATEAIMRDQEQHASSEIRSFCQKKWPDDYVMQKHCVIEQSKARGKAQSIDVMKSKVKMNIWGNCTAKWTDESELTNWVMMYHCYDAQWTAYQDLQR